MVLHRLDNYLSNAGDVDVVPSKGNNQLHQVDNYFSNANDVDIVLSKAPTNC